LTLQQSLYHYERILSQSHPAYLTRLRVDIFKIRDRNDNAMVVVSVIAMGDMCLQVLAGMLQISFFVSKFIICVPQDSSR